MNHVKLLTAAVLLTATLPFGAADAQGYGPCTPPVGVAVGAAGPAMNGGQLMAGVGQCAPIGSRASAGGYGAWGGAGGYGIGGGYGRPRIVQPSAMRSGYGSYASYGGDYPY
jgi:hypothetical protein